MYNFTVIIPHKEVADLLTRALESIPKRDDLEVIIVDDNSDPSKVDFDNFPGLRYPNTRVILTKEGRGAGYARNIGLDHARGKWVLFLDADDEFLPAINDILDECLKDGISDLIYYETKSYNVDEKREDKNPYIPMSGMETEDLRYNVTMISSKIIRKSIIDKYHIRCEEIGYSNDTFFSLKCAYYCRNLSIIPTVGYNYLIHSGSLWQTWTTESINCRIASAARIYKFSKKNQIPQGQDLARSIFLKGLALTDESSHTRYSALLLKYSWQFGMLSECIKSYCSSKIDLLQHALHHNDKL